MKTKCLLSCFVFIIALHESVFSMAQKSKTRIAVLGIHVNGNGMDEDFAVFQLRNKLSADSNFTVISEEETKSTLKKYGMERSIFNSQSKRLKAGEVLKADKAVYAEITAFNSTYKIHTEVYDVNSGRTELSSSRDFKRTAANIDVMFQSVSTEISTEIMKAQEMQKAFESRNSAQSVAKEAELTSKDEEEIIVSKYSLQGPRLGYTFLTGQTATLFKAPESKGGYGVNPALFQFGYQFEAQYLSNGNIQALVEFIPAITGMDQSKIFPSITILNGLRHTRYGIEFALGPTIFIRRTARGYYDNTGQWHLEYDYNGNTIDPITGYTTFTPNPYPVIEQVDSRGSARLASGVLFAVGKTFTSGNLNIPINGYVVPGKYGWRFGLSFGFNLRNDAKRKVYR